MSVQEIEIVLEYVTNCFKKAGWSGDPLRHTNPRGDAFMSKFYYRPDKTFSAYSYLTCYVYFFISEQDIQLNFTGIADGGTWLRLYKYSLSDPQCDSHIDSLLKEAVQRFESNIPCPQQ